MKFKDSKKYRDRLQAAQKSSGEKEALIVMTGNVCENTGGCSASFDFNFIGGSMSAGVGERFVLGAQTALSKKIPLFVFPPAAVRGCKRDYFPYFKWLKPVPF